MFICTIQPFQGYPKYTLMYGLCLGAIVLGDNKQAPWQCDLNQFIRSDSNIVSLL